jgi:hypothetical protein
MNVEIGTETPIFLFWEYLFRNFGVLSLQCRQARTGDTVLVKSREMTGRSQKLPLGLGGAGVKTTENKIHWPRWETRRVDDGRGAMGRDDETMYVGGSRRKYGMGEMERSYDGGRGSEGKMKGEGDWEAERRGVHT